MNEKRKKVEEYVMKMVTTIDPSGHNEAYYTKFFSSMSDKMFDSWMHMIRSGETRLYIYVENLKTALKTEDIFKAADAVGHDFFEPIRLWDTVGQRYYTTPHKYLTMVLPVRRLKQYLMDKISIPESDRRINPLSGQVTKPDKGSAISLVEAQTLDSKGLNKCFTELMTVRGGNVDAYAKFKSDLEETGQTRLDGLEMGGGVRSVLVAHVLLNAMHLDNNL